MPSGARLTMLANQRENPMDETERTYRTMCDKSIGKCASGHWLPLKGDCDLCGAGPHEKCKYVPEPTTTTPLGG